MAVEIIVSSKAQQNQMKSEIKKYIQHEETETRLKGSSDSGHPQACTSLRERHSARDGRVMNVSRTPETAVRRRSLDGRTTASSGVGGARGSYMTPPRGGAGVAARAFIGQLSPRPPPGSRLSCTVFFNAGYQRHRSTNIRMAKKPNYPLYSLDGCARTGHLPHRRVCHRPRRK